MYSSELSGNDRPVIFCLHYLGGSAREWQYVARRLDGRVRLVSLDLPGFGEAVQTPNYSVAEMAAFVARAIRLQAPSRWMLAGHSMGAKVALVLARSAEDGAPGLTGLEGLILLAGSPPGPEPMDEEQRQTMLGWFSGSAEANRADAQRYIVDNSSAKLDPAVADQAVADVLRAKRAAWVAWLDHGSREDWADRVGVVQTPTLVMAGADDANLGPDAQLSRTVPHCARATSVTLPGVRHLLPLECPQDVADLIEGHVDSVEAERRRLVSLDASYRALIASSRVGSATRAALSARELDDPSFEPAAMHLHAFLTLRAIVGRVLPQVRATAIDVAARIDEQLRSGRGDGWRFAELPPDAEAYRAGLLTLDEATTERYQRTFAEIDGRTADEVLTDVASGLLGSTRDDGAPQRRLNPRQMQSWFEDLRADAVRVYMAHPRTLARIGYSGIANGGDGRPKSGFRDIGIGAREDWEPLASTDLAR